MVISLAVDRAHKRGLWRMDSAEKKLRKFWIKNFQLKIMRLLRMADFSSKRFAVTKILHHSIENSCYDYEDDARIFAVNGK